MKQLLIALALILSYVTSVKGQCDMLIDYSIKDISSPAHGTLRMIFPDGKSTILIEDSVRHAKKVFHLEQLGNFL